MQTGPGERRRQAGRARRGESGHSRAEPRGGNQPVVPVPSARRSGEEVVRGRRAASEGRGWSEETGRLRWRINELEKEKLELTSTHNQELCNLQAALTRFRSSVERGEAQKVELQYQLTVSQRDAERVAELSRDKHSLTERAAELHQTVHDLQKALEITRQAREEDQHALQQEVEERDKLIQSFSSENQQLRQLLQEQEEALQESETRIAEVKQEGEKEAEVNRRLAGELKYLMEREERSRREKEASDQRGRSLESNIEAERAAHLESKFNAELIQLRVRDLEAVVAVERSGQQEAQSSLELLRTQFREVERAYTLERERSGSTGQALERMQMEYDQCKSDLTVALETERTMTSDLTEKLEEEKKRHSNIRSLLEQSDTEESHMNFVQKIRETLHQHINTGEHTQDTGCTSPAMHDGKPSPSAELLQLLKTTLVTSRLGLEETEKQVQDLLLLNQRLREENHSLQQLSSDQSRQIQVSVLVKLEEEVTRLRQESSDWSTQSRGLQAELQREREERAAEIQKMANNYENESKARLSFLHCLYQRLLAGCVLLTQPHSILGNFTWTELCDVIGEQVDRLSSDLHKANDKVSRLKSACEKKSVCVRELQRHQQRALSRVEEGVRRREEAWGNQLTQLQNELQVSRSQCDSLRDHLSSFELHRSSLTSDLARLRGLLSKSRRESASLLSACTLLAGAMKHTHHRLGTLCEQKRLLGRRLAEREVLEEEVRRLANALGDEEDDDEEERRGRMAVRRWRRSVWAVLAVRRWCTLAKQTTVLLRVVRGGGAPAVCVCGETATATRKVQNKPGADEDDGGDEGRDGVCARWLRSKSLSSTIMSCMADLQGALAHTGSAPPKVMAAAHSGLSRLLDHLLNQSDTVSCRLTPPQLNLKALVSTLQQHFLLFSQRLHSAEVERRSLRLAAANLKRGRRREGEDTCKTVPDERLHSVCVELREALTREREAQSLIQEQTDRLHTLQLQVDAHTREGSDTQRTLSQTTQVLSAAQQEVSRKERSLRILGKHLSSVQSERKQLEERLQRAEDELRDASRHNDELISDMKAAETSNKKVTPFPDETSLVIDAETPVPLTGQEAESKPSGPSHHNQAPSSFPLTKPPAAKMKEKKTTKKKNRGHVKSGGRK
ncbi:coiled-coil domain-containing protein 171-like [Limanda limanda]|uniref:coiled-coil domain-containing protein 171-like n=1 Tax=Limanda limanda TaxID=27771 RepID=UPI0029C89836|nr:coiled-coil domain-containing protein 171-like [Limanda limanda]